MPKCVKCGAKTSSFLSDYCKDCEAFVKENRTVTLDEAEPSDQRAETKYSAWMVMAWILFAVTALAAVVVIYEYGSYDVPSAQGSRTVYNPAVIVGAIGQATFMFMVAGLFTTLNQIRNMVAGREIEKEAVSSSG